MSEYLDEVFDGLKSMVDTAIELSDLSQAFEITGNVMLSNDITRLANSVKTAEDRIRRAVAKETNRLSGSS